MLRSLTLFSIFVCFAFPLLAHNGDDGKPALQYKAAKDFADWDPEFYFEPYIGATASFAGGNFLDYQRGFHTVTEEGTDFQGQILPLFFGTAGLQLRFTPFSDDDDVLSNFSIYMGLQYLQAGFTNKFYADHASDRLDYQDITDYRETYRHNYLAVPVRIRWGRKLFGDFGFTFVGHINSNHTTQLTREQSGDAAIDGGYSRSDRERVPLERSIMEFSDLHFSLGLGVQFEESAALALRANFRGDITNEMTPQDYRIYQLELSFFKTINL